MPGAPPHPEEDVRLEALLALGILDTDSEERFDRITRMARRLLDTEIALVSLVSSDRQWFKSHVGLDVQETPREQSFCAHAINDGALLEVHDATKDPRFAENPLVLGDPTIRFYAGAPIAAPGGQLVGTLCVIDSRPRKLDAEQIETLGDLAVLVERELAAMRLANIDELTGLINRRGFVLVFKQLERIAARMDVALSLLMLDVDEFKTINDTFGHDAGDSALRAVAAILSETFRSSDAIARLGGDEFCVLMLGESLPEARVPMSRLQENLERHRNSSSHPYRLALSAGLASSEPGARLSREQLIDAADELMYAHKRSKA